MASALDSETQFLLVFELPHSDGDQNILWLRQLLEWQQEVEDPRTYMTTLKIDLYPDEVYAFSPKGDVFSLPRGATPLDFADGPAHPRSQPIALNLVSDQALD